MKYASKSHMPRRSYDGSESTSRVCKVGILETKLCLVSNKKTTSADMGEQRYGRLKKTQKIYLTGKKTDHEKNVLKTMGGRESDASPAQTTSANISLIAEVERWCDVLRSKTNPASRRGRLIK